MMGFLMDHLIVLPIVLPMAVGAFMLLLGERRTWFKASLNGLSTLAMLAIAIALLRQADNGVPVSVAVYLPANWQAPFGIALAADRLSALMLLITSVLGLASLMFSVARWQRAGVHFHSLFQFQLMGLNGAFLTADLFNLFVFFEVLLAASYGLLLHGSGPDRVKAGLHYIAINLTGSMLFLIGVSIIYGITGSLNMADVALRIGQVAATDRSLLEVGAAILGVAFLIKGGAWPMNFWLPPSYAAASPPVAAVFSMMTKVGIYVLLRLSLLLFGDNAGDSAGFGHDWLLYTGLVTLGFGGIGMLAAQNLGRVAGYSVIISSGTLLASIGFGRVGVTGSALFYLLSSTLALGAFFLLMELVERSRTFSSDLLAITREAFGLDLPTDNDDNDHTNVGVAIPAAMAFLGLSFIACTLLLTGMPPLSGFIAKFSLLTDVLNPTGLTPDSSVEITMTAWVMLALLIGTGLTGVIALTRTGIRVFWAPSGRAVPRLRVIETFPIAALLVLCVIITLRAEPVMRYMDATAAALHAPDDYIRSVLSARQLTESATQAPSKVTLEARP
ncbi:multicomponent K+:H+ antiporter subunit D [Pigmentiphaga litoralis]|uniref:Multicomponent K+:H+ antiporter subunit D n=2 Tax=Pigmentiphaga litoralis TaxID=516702 RepID=A0A7Y9IVW5_9BURK|nr:monovalent cation/H+ antiporter subunit D [Pigmentiphaga litoralis]NYE22451.1 multicomponent K+:H+ antiporter subunit D [Pigmentiphaga litoralis]NYE83934.1 multicomponent K+:H+ antiporter subunit D [Pigmentiphaga litoralis]